MRGGDAWDQQIRRQIRECALFIPVVSAHTQSRLEGYFRREWRLAVDRTQDMADGKAFLVPVAIDDISERDAQVPDAFRAVQWTRLPAGQTNAAFAERVARLLSGDAGATPRTMRAAPSPATTDPKYRASRLGIILWAAIAIVVAMAMVGGWYVLEAIKARSSPAPSANGRPAPTAAPATAVDKSIAVLPFVDMSEKHDQEYFSDGLAEELLNALAKVPDLQVIARTSSFSFKGTNEDIPTIARKLSVAHVLEGSVRKSGRRLRITTQLVRADNGRNLWSETYDRDVDDVFKVQDEIARNVVEKLKGTLLGTPAAGRTASAEAHALYLQAQFFRMQDTEASLETAITHYQRAVEIDPAYAAAWASLAGVSTRAISNGPRRRDELIALARQAAEKAISLDATQGEAYAALAFLAQSDFRWQEAREILARGRELSPGNTTLLFVSGMNARALGRDAEAMDYYREARERDPVNLLTRRFFIRVLLQAGRIAEAEAEARQLIAMSPGFPAAHYLSGLVLLEKSEPAQALAAFERETDPEWRALGMPLALHALGRDREAQALIAAANAEAAGNEMQMAELYAFLGRREEAFRWLERAIAVRDPGVAWLRGDPLLRSLESDPRYAALMRQAKL